MQKIYEKSQTSFSSCCSFALDCTTNMLQECDAFVDSFVLLFSYKSSKKYVRICQWPSCINKSNAIVFLIINMSFDANRFSSTGRSVCSEKTQKSTTYFVAVQRNHYFYTKILRCKKKILCLRFRTFSLTKINRFRGGWKATKISIQIVLILGYAKYFLQRKRLYINQNRNFYFLIPMNNDEAKVIFRLLPNI